MSDQTGLDETRREWFYADSGITCAAEDCDNRVPCDRAAEFNPYCSDDCEMNDLPELHSRGFLDDPELLLEDDEDEDDTEDDLRHSNLDDES